MNERLTAEMLRARVDAMTDAQVIWKACRHYNREEVQFLIPADRAGCGIGSFYDEDSNVYNYESFKVGTLNLRTERFSVDGGVEPTADELRRAAEGMRRSSSAVGSTPPSTEKRSVRRLRVPTLKLS